MNWTFILTLILTLIFAIAFIGFGLWIIWRALVRFHRVQELQHKGLTTTGIVADIKTGKDSDGATTYTYTVVFTTDAGETRRHIFGESHIKRSMEEQVPLIYDPEKPEKPEILPLRPVLGPLILLMLGILNIGCGLACLIPLFIILPHVNNR